MGARMCDAARLEEGWGSGWHSVCAWPWGTISWQQDANHSLQRSNAGASPFTSVPTFPYTS